LKYFCRYNADLCFTPMLHSRIFTEDPKYQQEHLYNDVAQEDRPLIVQVCGWIVNLCVFVSNIAGEFTNNIHLVLICCVFSFVAMIRM